MSPSKMLKFHESGRVPVRLYVWTVGEDFTDADDAPQVYDWDKVSYVNRPVEYQNKGKYFSLGDAVKSLLPNYFKEKPQIDSETKPEVEDEQTNADEVVSNSSTQTKTTCSFPKARLMFVRVQGIVPKLEIPFSWVVNNLMSPDYFLHLCVCIKVSKKRITNIGSYVNTAYAVFKMPHAWFWKTALLHDMRHGTRPETTQNKTVETNSPSPLSDVT